MSWSLQTEILYHLVHDPAPGVHLLSPSESPVPDVASQRACRPGRKGLQRHTIRPLYLTCTTWTADLRPGTLIDVAAATPEETEETETPSRSLRVLGNRLERLWNCGTARQERKQRGTIIIGNSASSIRANGYVNRKQHIWLPPKRVMVTPAVYPRLF